MEEKKINTNASQKLTPDELGKIAGGAIAGSYQPTNYKCPICGNTLSKLDSPNQIYYLCFNPYCDYEGETPS